VFTRPTTVSGGSPAAVTRLGLSISLGTPEFFHVVPPRTAERYGPGVDEAVHGGAVMADPGAPRHESVVDKQIRLAQARGDFDNLPGKGKPLSGAGDPPDELWWVKGYLRREGISSEMLLPPSIQLRKEIERLPETLRGLTSEQAVRDAVAELNLRIVDFLRAPSGPRVQISRVNADHAVHRWRTARSAPAAPAESAVDLGSAPKAAPGRTPGPRAWFRWFRRRQDAPGT
jgi:hypothetical protein